MELNKAIEKLNNLIKNANVEDMDMNDIFGGEHIEAIDTVLKELDNRIPIDRIKNLNKIADDMIAKAEENMKYGRYKQYGGKIKFYRLLSRLYGYKEVLNILLNKE